MGTDNVLGGFIKSLLQRPPILGHAQTIPMYKVSSQDVFYRCSLKVDKNLAREFGFLKFP